MKRQIAFVPVVVLLLLTLVAGVIGGAVVGGASGYWLASRNDDAAPAATVQETTSPEASQAAPEADSMPVEADTETGDIDAIVSKVNPAVVTIENQQRGLGGGITAGMGSGFIIDEEGHIVTNNHVVEGASSLNVIFSDGREVPATLVGADPYQDVAVIKVEGDVPATVSFGDSSQLQPGQRVVAIGSALGEFRNTVTDGIVSGTDRSLDTGEGYRIENLVQHDAPINPGNSGGPLIDLKGRVVGMNTAVVRGGFGQPGAEGLGFAIDSNTVKAFADELIANGKIARPYLGINFRPVVQGFSTSDSQPVMIVEVVDGGPADSAGVRAGDVILAVDGTQLDEQNPFLNLIFRHKPGDTVSLEVERADGSSATISLTLGERPEQL